LRTLLTAGFAALLSTAAVLAQSHPGTKDPPMTPAQAQKNFAVPPGFEVRLFAAEPDIVNPVSIAFDERGRLWVLELYEYPLGAPKGAKPRDRIKILEDTDGDGKADKISIFADGLNLGTGLVLGNGGAYVGQAPHFLFLKDTDGDGVADSRTIIRTGFGLQDTHELLNGFIWGPDGWMYMTHGVFTHSVVKDPNNPADEGMRMNAAVARYHPKKNKFEMFADGTSNPWGVDFDRYGNAFLSACVIDHLFHIAPGGIYVRQGGQPGFPYSYELLKSIVDHKHFHAAYCGVLVYQGDAYPEAYRNKVYMGNIHGNSVNCDVLTRNGSSFRASGDKDLLNTKDGWFRSVMLQVGPDGNIWIADWYDKYPCYQHARRDPAGVDREHGRIWRVVYVGNDKNKKVPTRPDGLDLGRMSGEQLVGLLDHPNMWHRRTAQRLLTERGDAQAAPALRTLLSAGKTLEGRLAALWTLHGIEQLDDATLDALAGDKEFSVRMWVARLTAERGDSGAGAMVRLLRLAKDPDASVRLAVAWAARRLGAGQTTPIVGALLEQPGTAEDPMLPFMIWMAGEPRVAADPKPVLDWIRNNAGSAGAAGANFARRTMRRIWDTKKADAMDEAVVFLDGVAAQPALAAAALDGILDAQKPKIQPPGRSPSAVLAKLTKSGTAAVADRARRLAALWGDVSASEAALAALTDGKAADADRIAAARIARQLKSEPARKALLAGLAKEKSEPVYIEIVRALGDVGGDAVPAAVLARWKDISPEARRASADVLAARTAWANALLDAVAAKAVAPADVSITTMRLLSQTDDKALRDRTTALLGRFRAADADRAKLIAAKRSVVLGGAPDMKIGEAMFTKHCAVCHQLHGKGGQVGPDITGVGRASLESLLVNMLDPNQVIGKGYEQVVVKTKDERTVAGRLVEDTAAHVKILAPGAPGEPIKEEVIGKADIEGMRVTDQSVMPEGVEKQMNDAEFRSLVWYVFNHPADKDRKVRIEVNEKNLVIRSTVPGAAAPVELAQYQMNPALRPYLHPVRDPAGMVVLTDDRPSDHPHQHGIFTGLHKVNGLDFWHEKEGKQRFSRLLDVQSGPDRAGWRSLTEWVGPGNTVVMQEEQQITVYAPDSPEYYVIDFDWLLRPAGKPITFGRYDYGGLSVRMKFDPKRQHLNAAGERGGQTSNKQAAWCNVAMPFDGKYFGIAILEHPGNLNYPNLWRVDGQGMINPCPSLTGDWSIAAGRERLFRYRLVVHRGAGTAEVINREHERFSAGSAPPPPATR
jgi:putative membrane-bound dehydrogenase-like protein